MTLTKLQKDIQTYSFNEGQICMIQNLQSTNFKDIQELFMLVNGWKIELEKKQAAIFPLDEDSE